MKRKIEVRPVTSDNWEDFVRLFEAKGSPHYCWCTPYRLRAQDLTKVEKKAQMQKLVSAGTPIGVLAYDRDQPIGWCSVAPRETYVRLARSRTMPRVTAPATPTWTILCFFVARSHRDQGVTHALLEGAVVYAKRQGARVVEGYPFDTAGISATHQGHSRVFEEADFEREERRWLSICRGMGPRRCRSIPPWGPHRRDVCYLPFFWVRCPAFCPGLSRLRYDSPSMTRS
jgi:GNAT superfamily N-acetyltransferase